MGAVQPCSISTCNEEYGSDYKARLRLDYGSITVISGRHPAYLLGALACLFVERELLRGATLTIIK